MSFKSWVRAVGGAFTAEAAQIAAAIGWVAFYSYVIRPGQGIEVYQAHAQVSGPWVSIVAGMPIFYAASRWIAGSRRAALALFGVFLLLDVALLASMGERPDGSELSLFGLSYVTKLAACYLGGRG